MRWFSGDIAEAIRVSKSKGAIFVVYIQGIHNNFFILKYCLVIIYYRKRWEVTTNN